EIIVLGDLELFAPEYALGEIDRHKEELRARMDISQEEFNVVLNLILSHVVVVSRERYESFEAHAQKICPDQRDCHLQYERTNRFDGMTMHLSVFARSD